MLIATENTATRATDLDGSEDLLATEEHPGPNEDDPECVPDEFYFIRGVSLFLTFVGHQPDASGLTQKLEAALKADSRISHYQPVKVRPQWGRKEDIYPGARWGEAPEQDDLLSGGDHLHLVPLSDPLVFTVVVPVKNQPLFRDVDDVPTDTYFVSWDGVTCFVGWRTDADSKLPRSGGHVVLDILADVAARAGFSVYQQPCSPGCRHGFWHRTMKLGRVKGGHSMSGLKTRSLHLVEGHIHAEGTSEDVVGHVGGWLKRAGETFAFYKNNSRRVKDLEILARGLVATLLSEEYIRLKEREDGVLRSRARAIWQSVRGQRTSLRELTTAIWLSLTHIETLSEPCGVWLRRYQESSSRRRGPFSDLFELDLKEDEFLQDRQDLTFIRAALERTGSGAEQRAIAIATAGGAGAAVLGALIGGILT